MKYSPVFCFAPQGRVGFLHAYGGLAVGSFEHAMLLIALLERTIFATFLVSTFATADYILLRDATTICAVDLFLIGTVDADQLNFQSYEWWWGELQHLLAQEDRRESARAKVRLGR